MLTPAELPRCIAIAGPTASGKTAAALALAEQLPVEIISVDSALVYRGMDIGTAKPSAEERARVPHHLIDILDPSASYSAARFVREASDCVQAVHARGRVPLLVGGTMLYFKAWLEGLDELPPADPAVRAALDDEARQHGWPALHARLCAVDPVTGARLALGDTQRVQRALEVWQLTGRPLSSFHTRSATSEPTPAQGATTLIALEPDNRAWLHERIALRFDQMLDQGLLDEVRALRARGDLNPDLPSMRCVGYRQAWQALDGQFPMAELRERGIYATRQLAKRQITWLRSMPQRQVVAFDRPDALARVIALALAAAREPASRTPRD